MPHWRPLATATSATAIAALLAIGITGGHSPFAVTSAAQQPAANAVAGETASPELADVAPSDDAAATTPTAATDPTATAAGKPKSGGATSTSSGGSTSTGASGATRGSGTGSTSAPTPKPTAKPAPRPTAAPTPKPVPTPAPVAQSGTLHITDTDAGPRLSWTQCSAANFAAYAVVRSLDSEIHYPAEDLDTVVALITSAGTTSLTDTGAPNARVYYAVWCLSKADAEYKTIWKTPTLVYAP